MFCDSLLCLELLLFSSVSSVLCALGVSPRLRTGRSLSFCLAVLFCGLLFCLECFSPFRTLPYTQKGSPGLGASPRHSFRLKIQLFFSILEVPVDTFSAFSRARTVRANFTTFLNVMLSLNSLSACGFYCGAFCHHFTGTCRFCTLKVTPLANEHVLRHRPTLRCLR